MGDITNEVLSIIVKALITVIGTYALRYLIPALVLKLKEWGVMKFVKAAEKKYGTGTGELKRQYVLSLAKKYLPKMDETLLETLVEACCEQLDLMWAAVAADAAAEPKQE